MRVTAQAFSEDVKNFDQVKDCLSWILPHTSAAHLYTLGSLVSHTTSALETIASPLQVLRLGAVLCQENIQFRIHAVTCTTIVTLKLSGFWVQHMPRLPALRKARFSRSRIDLRGLLALFRYSPRLQSLELVQALAKGALDPLSSLPKPHIDLPRLQDLIINDTSDTVSSILDIFPDPTTSFVISVSESGDTAATWSFDTGCNGRILERLVRFRDMHTEDKGVFAIGRVMLSKHASVAQRTTQIRFNTASPFNKSRRVYYKHESEGRIVEIDPLLDHVTVLEVEWTVDIDPQWVDFACLPCVRKLELVFIQADCTEICTLEAWIVQRHQQGNPLESVTFRHCSESSRPFFDCIAAAGVAKVIQWTRRMTSY